ncbi:hypothetical protein K7432_008423 [Basidiobolus ranarum]|uniref:Uncharacterized protein n=1 Tax=Basidiobolus ranarum TaxID=34480 RepID=A0ABR2VZ39_9FUNG
MRVAINFLTASAIATVVVAYPQSSNANKPIDVADTKYDQGSQLLSVQPTSVSYIPNARCAQPGVTSKVWLVSNQGNSPSACENGAICMPDGKNVKCLFYPNKSVPNCVTGDRVCTNSQQYTHCDSGILKMQQCAPGTTCVNNLNDPQADPCIPATCTNEDRCVDPGNSPNYVSCANGLTYNLSCGVDEVCYNTATSITCGSPNQDPDTTSTSESSGSATPIQSTCVEGNWKCLGSQIAECVSGQWITTACAAGTTCQEIGGGTYCETPAVQPATPGVTTTPQSTDLSGSSIESSLPTVASGTSSATIQPPTPQKSNSPDSGSGSTVKPTAISHISNAQCAQPGVTSKIWLLTNQGKSPSACENGAICMPDGKNVKCLFYPNKSDSNCVTGDRICTNSQQYTHCDTGILKMQQCAPGTTCVNNPADPQADPCVTSTCAEADRCVDSGNSPKYTSCANGLEYNLSCGPYLVCYNTATSIECAAPGAKASIARLSKSSMLPTTTTTSKTKDISTTSSTTN